MIPSENENAATLRKAFRLALLELGKSPDYHIYDLTDDFLLGRKEGTSRRLLIRVKQIFDGLKPEEQKYFNYECLERERHYRFWYLGDYHEKEWAKARADMEQKIQEAFPCRVL